METQEKGKWTGEGQAMDGGGVGITCMLVGVTPILEA